jgi:hypothetical protein
MIDQLIILLGYPWWIWVLVALVAGIIGTGGYFFYYHIIKYPNGKPKTKKS